MPIVIPFTRTPSGTYLKKQVAEFAPSSLSEEQVKKLHSAGFPTIGPATVPTPEISTTETIRRQQEAMERTQPERYRTPIRIPFMKVGTPSPISVPKSDIITPILAGFVSGVIEGVPSALKTLGQVRRVSTEGLPSLTGEERVLSSFEVGGAIRDFLVKKGVNETNAKRIGAATAGGLGVLDVFFIGGLVKAGISAGLRATLPNVAREIAWKKLGGGTIDEARASAKEILKEVSSNSSRAVRQGTVDEAIEKEVKTALSILEKEGVPSKISTEARKILRVFNQDVREGLETSFRPKPEINVPFIKVAGELPGYRPKPGQAPVFGLSVQEVEGVGREPIRRVIPSDLEPLAQEARKYKSAEEFVNGTWRERVPPNEDIRITLEKLRTTKRGLENKIAKFEPGTKQHGNLNHEIDNVSRTIKEVNEINQFGYKTLADFYNKSVKSVEIQTPHKTSTEATDTYWKDAVEPKIKKGEPLTISADEMKDYFGKDYDPERAIFYSHAANDALRRALVLPAYDTFRMIGAGPGSGKTEIVQGSLVKIPKGIIYESTLSSYEAAKARIKDAMDAGKKVEIYGIVPDIQSSYRFTISRGERTGRKVSLDFFARAHSSVVNTLIRLLEDGENVKIIDHRGITTPQEIVKMWNKKKYLENPLDILKSVRYTEDEIKNLIQYDQARRPQKPERAEFRAMDERGIARPLSLPRGGGPDQTGRPTPTGGGRRVFRGEAQREPGVGFQPEMFGGVAGIEEDEEGKITFDPMKAVFGVFGLSTLNKFRGIRPLKGKTLKILEERFGSGLAQQLAILGDATLAKRALEKQGATFLHNVIFSDSFINLEGVLKQQTNLSKELEATQQGTKVKLNDMLPEQRGAIEGALHKIGEPMYEEEVLDEVLAGKRPMIIADTGTMTEWREGLGPTTFAKMFRRPEPGRYYSPPDSMAEEFGYTSENDFLQALIKRQGRRINLPVPEAIKEVREHLENGTTPRGGTKALTLYQEVIATANKDLVELPPLPLTGRSIGEIDREIDRIALKTSVAQKEAQAEARALEKETDISLAAKKDAYIKELTQRRAKVRAYRDALNLDDNDIRKVSRKDPRFMTSVEFRRFLDEIERRAVELQKTKELKNAVLYQIENKELSKVENLQKFMKLPTINLMTPEQLEAFNDALTPYMQGDEFLTIRKLELIDRTTMKGLRTIREVIDHIRKTEIEPPEELMNTDYRPTDRYRYTSLARRNPLYRIIMDDMNASIFQGDRDFLAFEDVVDDLTRKARASRKIVEVGEKIKQAIAPLDENVFEYLDGSVKRKAELRNIMTKEELDLAGYLQQWLAQARDYLIAQEVLKAYRENYITHIQRGWLEAFVHEGIKPAFKELFKKMDQEEAIFNILDGKTGEILALEKFFPYKLRREGVGVPSKNIGKVAKTYARAFYRKQALDREIVKLDIYVYALGDRSLTERGLAMDEGLQAFFKDWMNNFKGRRVSFGRFLPQGGRMDTALRVANAGLSLLDIGANIPLQLTLGIGEQIGTLQALGMKRYALGQARLRTKMGKEIARAHREFTGRTLWSEFRDTSDSLGQKFWKGMFGLMHYHNRRANEIFLLGSLSPEEWSAGAVSDKRLAFFKREMARYRAVPGMRSLAGSTSLGESVTKYRSWAIPILSTTISNLNILQKRIRSKEFAKFAKDREFHELLRATIITMTAVLVAKAVMADEEDDSFLGKIAQKAYRDALSLVGALDISFYASAPRIAGFIGDLGAAAKQILLLEKYEDGRLKGPVKLQRTITPRFVKDITEAIIPEESNIAPSRSSGRPAGSLSPALQRFEERRRAQESPALRMLRERKERNLSPALQGVR